MSDSTVLHRPEGLQDWQAEAGAGITKIVVGKLDADSLIELPSLPANFAELFPALTHLHLWNIGNLEALPPLRPEMRTLDVRKCPKFRGSKVLPCDLETLDLGDCPEVVDFPTIGLSGLRHFHLDACRNLAADFVTCFLRGCTELEEFTAKDCSQFHTLCLPPQSIEAPPLEVWQHPRFPPARLKKLVLSGCSGLTSLPELSSYPWLHHLDLDGCSKLERLSPICADYDRGIQYLSTAGCDALRSFGSPDNPMDVRAPHRSKSPGDNVATQFRTLQRLSGTPVDHVMAKVLLLGSGRCGKTTLAKVLQGKEPNESEKSTHGIKLWAWKTQFVLPGEAQPRQGVAHIWDFAGQEIYHGTHRLFASQGSVFVIVTCSPEEHGERLRRELKKIGSPARRAVVERENEYRELKYWLDFVRGSLASTRILENGKTRPKRLEDVLVRVVYTGTNDSDEAKRRLISQAGSDAELIRKGRIRVDGIDLFAPGASLNEVEDWVQCSLGIAADDLGIRVPAAYRAVARGCATRVAKVFMHMRAGVVRFGRWTTWVDEKYPVQPDVSDAAGVRIEQARAIASYLHGCGRVFWLGRDTNSPAGDVIVDQRTIAETIYSLCTNKSADRVAELRVPFSRSELIGCLKDVPMFVKHVQHHEHAVDVFLDMIDQCNVCVRDGQDRWFPVHRELLPDADAEQRIRDEARDLWDAVAESSGDFVNHSFALHGNDDVLLGNCDYRNVVAYVARHHDSRLPLRLFGDDGEKEARRQTEADWSRDHVHYQTNTLLWRDGMQVVFKRRVGNHATESTVLRAEWAAKLDPNAPTGRYGGGIFVQLLCRDEPNFAERLRSILFDTEGPLPALGIEPTDQRPPNLAAHSRARLRGDGAPRWMDPSIERDAGQVAVAISFRTADVAIAEEVGKALTKALQGRGLGRVAWYSDVDFEAERKTRNGSLQITDVYEALRDARLLIVIASKDYFQSPSLDTHTREGVNLYCPVELAEAVRRKSPNSFLWLRKDLSRAKVAKEVTDIVPLYRNNVIGARLKSVGFDRSRLERIDIYEHDAFDRITDGDLREFLDAVGRNHVGAIDVQSSGTWVKETIEWVKQSLEM